MALTTEQKFNHVANLAFISFGISIAAAAELEVDLTPVGGFDNAELDILLKLK